MIRPRFNTIEDKDHLKKVCKGSQLGFSTIVLLHLRHIDPVRVSFDRAGVAGIPTQVQGTSEGVNTPLSSMSRNDEEISVAG